VLELDTTSRGAHLPYEEADLDAARAWLDRLPETEVSQRHLTELWKPVVADLRGAGDSAWLDGGPRTMVTELREGSRGITVLMEVDRPRVRANPKHLLRLLLPMSSPPRSVDWRAWPRQSGIPVAWNGSIKYDPMRGAEWNA
jgi:hypothetical protein